MTTLRVLLSDIVSGCFEDCGFDATYGAVFPSARKDLGQFQCNGALAAAKEYGRNPREIATAVVAKLGGRKEITSTSVAGPGFINITLDDAFLTDHLAAMRKADLGIAKSDPPRTIIIDYGGANIGKPLHVGHFRPGIIGEVLKRTARCLGHRVIGDVHLGDWGLQMGMIISEIKRRKPELAFFDPDHGGAYPTESPVTAEELLEVYPSAATRCKADEASLEEARRITRELQEGNPAYRALWQAIRNVSVANLRTDYHTLGIDFDLWLGESDSQERIAPMVARLAKTGVAERSRGALVIFVNEPEDTREIPPFMLEKTDGGALYATTDLATIEERMEEYDPDLILYVTDKRQNDHFLQVFRAARKSGIAPAEQVELDHLGHGTMNGPDGKPFKTRSGGVMSLKELIAMLIEKAHERMAEAEVAGEYTEEEKRRIAKMVGIAALKYGDLMNQPLKDYSFDPDRFTSFEGKTGPYILYTAVRIKSILRKASAEGLAPGRLLPPASEVERSLHLALTSLPEQVASAFAQRAPHFLCEYLYEVASLFAAFYRDHHILTESDPDRQSSWLELSSITLEAVELVSGLLVIDLPERM